LAGRTRELNSTSWGSLLDLAVAER
jgi:hypothetical protein